MQKITIPKKVETYSNSFKECGKLKLVTVEGRITDCRAFEYTNIKKLILNNSEMENFFPVTNNKVETLIISKNVKKVRWNYDVYGYAGEEDTVLPEKKNVIRKMIVQDKNTKFENIEVKYQSIKKLYTVKGAKAINWAENNDIKYKVLSKKEINKMCKK